MPQGANNLVEVIVRRICYADGRTQGCWRKVSRYGSSWNCSREILSSLEGNTDDSTVIVRVDIYVFNKSFQNSKNDHLSAFCWTRSRNAIQFTGWWTRHSRTNYTPMSVASRTGHVIKLQTHDTSWPGKISVLLDLHSTHSRSTDGPLDLKTAPTSEETDYCAIPAMEVSKIVYHVCPRIFWLPPQAPQDPLQSPPRVYSP